MRSLPVIFAAMRTSRENAVRLLLIAYEYPPSPSPQSLRWAYLVRELLELGVEVEVLSVEVWWPAGDFQPPPGAVVHRSPAGGVARLVALARRWRRFRGRFQQSPRGSGNIAGRQVPMSGQAKQAPSMDQELNWKGRLLQRFNGLVARYTFPDQRGRWEHPARRKLLELLESFRPDVVVSSHEPATTLRLGRIARQRGFPWLADLGDPVLSFYTPARWHKEARRLEERACREADRITVTTKAAARLLANRHQVPLARFEVLTQGYDATGGLLQPPGVSFDPAVLELLYTGSFYQFREPRALVDGVLATPGARLNIATSRAPDWLLPLLEQHPRQLRLLGFVPHAQAVALQRSADVLVNIANEDSVHVPGKVYEYLGAGRPILHIGDHDGDGAAQLVQTHRRGLVCGNSAESIAAALAGFAAIKRADSWVEEFQLDHAGVEQYQWRSIARRLHSILAEVAKIP